MSTKLSKDEFIAKLKEISCATSVEDGTLYCDFQFTEDMLSGIRYHPSEESQFSLKLDELYTAYLKHDKLNTAILKKYISDWAQSPALAIFIEAGLTKYKK